jgi:hypothetical protein
LGAGKIIGEICARQIGKLNVGFPFDFAGLRDNGGTVSEGKYGYE